MLPLFLTPNAFAEGTQSITYPTSVVSIFLSLLLVIGVIFALAYVMRRFNVTSGTNGQMYVVASMMAGTKEKVMVIQVGEEQHLIGVTSQTISHLSKLDKHLEVKSTNLQSNGDVFQNKLVAAMAGKLNPATSKGDKDA